MAITLVGVGTFSETASSTTIAPALPSGVQSGDLILVLLACGEDSPQPSVTSEPSGYAVRGTGLFYDYGAGGMSQWVYWKIAGSSESAPSFTLNTGNSTGGGIWAATSVWRGVDNADPFALDTPSQSTVTSSSSTYTPPDVTTDHDNATIVSFVTSSDNNALALSTANGYTLSGISGANYDSTLGSDGALGMAYKIGVGAAGTYSLPTWSQTSGPDYWCYQTTALKDGTPSTNANAITATGTASANADTANVSAGGTGAAALTAAALAGAVSVSAWTGYAAATGSGLDATAEVTAGAITFNAQVAEGTALAIAARGSLAASLGFAAGRSS